MSTDYLKIQQQNNRTEYAKRSEPADRFIHSQERKNRKVGVATQPIYVNNFTAVVNKNYAPEGSVVPMLMPSSCKVCFSAPNNVEAKRAWEAVKIEIDQIFTSEDTVFRGLPISSEFLINN